MPIPLPSFDKVLEWIKRLVPAMRRLWRDYINGPAIEAKLLQSATHPVFALEVKNVGGGTVVPFVYLEGVTDEKGRITEIATPTVEIWCESGDQPRLFGSARALFSILIVGDGLAGWFLYVKEVVVEDENGSFNRVGRTYPLVTPRPMAQHKEIRLRVRVVFCSPNDLKREIIDEAFLYSVMPKGDSGEFTVRLLKPKFSV
jgi:hypothetical protein